MVGADGPSDAHETFAQFFENAGERGVIQTQPAVFFRHGDAEKPQVLHLIDEIMGDPVLPVQFGGHGFYVPAYELPDHVDYLDSGLFGALPVVKGELLLAVVYQLSGVSFWATSRR